MKTRAQFWIDSVCWYGEGNMEEVSMKELLEKLREAESIMGSPTTEMFMDRAAPEHRLNWLRSARKLLESNGVEPENLPGRWHT